MDAQEKDKETYDQHVQEPNHYKTRDLVYLDSQNLPLHLPILKLRLKSVGPFPVAGKVRTSAYRLVLPSTWRIHPVFNEALQRPFQGNPAMI